MFKTVQKKFSKGFSLRNVSQRGRGFSLIELIVVIAIIGILVMLATPKFMGYVEASRIANIQNDTKVTEDKVEELLINETELPEDWEVVDKADLDKAVDEKKLYGKGGLVAETNTKEKIVIDGEYKVVPKDFIVKEARSKLEGNFYASNKGKVYYEDLKSGSHKPGKPGKPGDKDDGTIKDIEDSITEVEDDLSNAGPNPSDDDIKDLEDKVDDIQDEIDKLPEGPKKDKVQEGLDKVKDEIEDIKNKVDKTELDKAIVEAEKLDKDDYTDTSWKDLESAINKGKQVRDDDEATQVEVDDAIKSLEDATNGLVDNPETTRINDLIREGYIPIANAQELNNIRYDKSGVFGSGTKWEGNYVSGLSGKKYIQVKDINLSSYSNFNPLGQGDYTFSESEYDGNGLSVSNLKINETIKSRIGLFGIANGSVIKNVNISNANVSGRRYVGILVGEALSTTVKNSSVSGEVNGEEWVGGLIGMHDSSSVASESYSSANVTGKYSVGGLIGYVNWGSSVVNSYSTGNVHGEQNVGGLIGWLTNNSTDVTNSYTIGRVTGNQIINGLVGVTQGRINNSFHDIETTTRPKGGYNTGRSTAEMKTVTTYAGWDTNIWKLIDGEYPTLR